LELKTKEREFAWGIHAQYKPSVVMLIMYHLLILVGPFAALGTWEKRHPLDVSNAAVPLSIVLTFTSLFWSTVGPIELSPIPTPGEGIGPRVTQVVTPRRES
jgi:hypothetical protein